MLIELSLDYWTLILDLATQNDFAKAARRAKKSYELKFPRPEDRSPHGVSLAIEEEYKVERKKHDSAFRKLLAIANPHLGDEWLNEIKKHWDTNDSPQMQLEKLHKLVLSQVDDQQKVKWLKIWNSGAARKGEEGFPTGTVSDKELELFLHKATYWYQVCISNHFNFSSS